MRSFLLLPALLAPALLVVQPAEARTSRHASRAAAAEPRPDGRADAPTPDAPDAAGATAPDDDLSLGSVTLALAHVVADLELPIPHELIDPFLRWQVGLRELARGTADRLIGWTTGWSDQLHHASPDLSILTTEPVANTESSGFGWRDDPIRHNRSYHRGADFRARSGTPVLAAGDGMVVFCGRQRGYGNVIYVDHGGGVVTRYAHLRRILTKRKALVTAGERIGQVGRTGRATGPHLHFEVRLDGRAVDPVTAMRVAALEREDVVAGRIAALALAPGIQDNVVTREDPPRHHTRRRHHHRGHRPERHGRHKRPQVLW